MHTIRKKINFQTRMLGQKYVILRNVVPIDV